MTYMLCRNRVADFDRWHAVFTSHRTAHREAGLELVKLWRAVEEPNHVFFMFAVASVDQAREFIHDPAAAEAGRASGVIDGEYYFVDDAGGY